MMVASLVITGMLAALAIAAALVSVLALCMAPNAPLIMEGQPAAASARVEEMLTAVCRGDYGAV